MGALLTHVPNAGCRARTTSSSAIRSPSSGLDSDLGLAQAPPGPSVCMRNRGPSCLQRVAPQSHTRDGTDPRRHSPTPGHATAPPSRHRVRGSGGVGAARLLTPQAALPPQAATVRIVRGAPSVRAPLPTDSTRPARGGTLAPPPRSLLPPRACIGPAFHAAARAAATGCASALRHTRGCPHPSAGAVGRSASACRLCACGPAAPPRPA